MTGREDTADAGRRALVDTYSAIDGRRVHALVTGPLALATCADSALEARRLVVVVPGLGLTRYVRVLATEVAARGATCAVLDLPGFAVRGPRGADAEIWSIGAHAAAWVRERAGDRSVVLVGHSTGSQAALTAALDLQDDDRDLSLVLAGPTFTPAQRRWPALLRATATAYQDDRVSALDPREAVRGVFGIPRILLSGMADAPEDRVASLRVPLTLTAGVDDSFAPAWWLERLAASAVAAPSTRVVLIGGSHNNPDTHPVELADVILTPP